MADQREHGNGGPEWRNRPAHVPDEPLVPLTGRPGGPVDETFGVAWRGGTGDDDRGYHGDLFDPGEDEGPLDLVALRADEELLASVGSFDHAAGAGDHDPALRALLMSWRLDVDAEPMAELVDTRVAADVIFQAARARKRRPRFLVPLASAAAVLVVAFTGMGLAARAAQPGDPLWGLSQVLYSDHARSIEAAFAVRDELNHATVEFRQGHLNAARTALAQAQSSLPSVSSEDGKAVLQAQGQTLAAQLNATTTPTPSLTPSVTMPVTTTTPPVTTTKPPTTTPPSTTTPPPTTTTPPHTSTGSGTSTTPSVAPQSSNLPTADPAPQGGQAANAVTATTPTH